MLKIGQKSNLIHCFLIKYFEQIAFHDLLKQHSICFIKKQSANILKPHQPVSPYLPLEPPVLSAAESGKFFGSARENF